jgi:hypothetical protein
MNIVRAKPSLGQFPGEGIASDITLGPQDTSADNFPMYNDPGLLLAEQGATTAAPAPSTSVPQAPSSPSPVYATFGPSGTTVPSLMTAAPPVNSPAPRVNIPLTTPSGFLSSSVAGIPMIAVLGIGLVGLLALSGGKGRRR